MPKYTEQPAHEHAEAFDTVVLGTGGGLKIALPAAQRGLRVAVLEEDAVGGTCLNRGCIPSKMLIYPLHRADEALRLAALGVHFTRPVVDFQALVKRISATVDEISAEQRSRLQDTPNLTFITGHAEFVENHTLRVGERLVTAPRIFIAGGSRPTIPDIPGLHGTPFMTSREALRRTTLPRRMLVLGAGYVATELGYAYAAAGSEVVFLVRSRFLRHEDPDIATEFERVFLARHKAILHFVPSAVTHQDGRFTVRGATPEGEPVFEGDALLVATGVQPNTDRLGLEHTDIRLAPGGWIDTNACLQTAVPGVYAFGDIIGRHLFRHTVNYEGEYLTRTAFGTGTPPPLDYGPVPHAVFTDPEVAAVGQTEPEARAAGIDCLVGTATYADSAPGMARGADGGLAKLIFDRRSRLLIGAHIVGDDAATLVHLLIGLMKKHGTLDELLDMIFIHPVLPEVVRDAARNARDAQAGSA